jgi:sporulation protein YlmC with PRC-barrel domain
MVWAAELFGRQVVNAAGEPMGAFGDVMVALGSGEIVFAILEYDQALVDLRARIFPIPLNSLRWDSARETVVLDADEDALERAPGLEEDWPNVADARWAADTLRLWNDLDIDVVTRYATAADLEAVDGPVIRGVDLLGQQIEGPDGNMVGEVAELVIDLGQGTVPYVILLLNGALPLADRHLAVPTGLLHAGATPDGTAEGEFVLDVPEDRLAAAPGFDSSTFPNLTDPGWDEEVQDFWTGGAAGTGSGS